MNKDLVDIIVEQWNREFPGLDTTPMAVTGRLSRVTEYLGRGILTNHNKHGLNNCEFDVLATLRRSGEPYQLTPTQLYSSLMLSSGTMTNRLDQLEKRGLIERKPNPEDRRGLLVNLTPKGKTLIDTAYPDHLDNEKKLIQVLDHNEIEDLNRILKKLLSSYEK
ncbi:MarR family winged helix-turn-helix transcriptional regulator [Spirochaeta cellobiosiphila]|uniref:MarR family winged helix-turn-helix transcriptional regulator n=1 Tax=Spirochaeta cellobiosiphila TaxID=504483 RepID=UPI0003FF8914|nr:MarR family transcriptional regulator [Spirochaeta cellobiosiphila]